MKLQGGNNNLKVHLDKHDNEKYSITKDELADILNKTMLIAVQSGAVTAAKIRKCLPVKKRWNLDFLNLIKAVAENTNQRRAEDIPVISSAAATTNTSSSVAALKRQMLHEKAQNADRQAADKKLTKI